MKSRSVAISIFVYQVGNILLVSSFIGVLLALERLGLFMITFPLWILYLFMLALVGLMGMMVNLSYSSMILEDMNSKSHISLRSLIDILSGYLLKVALFIGAHKKFILLLTSILITGTPMLTLSIFAP